MFTLHVAAKTMHACLWNIHYNSLLNLNYTNQTKFADDLILVARDKTVREAESIANVELSKVSAWAKQNKIRFNEQKSKVMLMKVISNKDLWRVTGQEDINLEIRKRKLRRIGHTLRKEDGEIPKAALLRNPQGSRKRGRPKNSWRRSVIKEVGRSWNELRFLAADRQKWKELIDNLCS
jgi:hypothetical protein